MHLISWNVWNNLFRCNANKCYTFFWLGKLTDQFNLTVLGLITLGILSGFSFLLSSAETLYILFLSLLGLRLFGQSMISHIAVTAMARWFSKKRGRALSIALMGHPIGEALLPLLLLSFFISVHMA